MSLAKELHIGSARFLAAGFTVIEFAITLVLVAISLSLSIPSLQGLRANNQIVAANNVILTGMNLARATAMTTGKNITICPSSHAFSCSQNSWESGWIVFNDANNDGVADDGEVIRRIIHEGTLVDSGYGGAIVFQSDGTTLMESDTTITYCYKHSSISTQCLDVIVSAMGRITSTKHLAQEKGREDAPVSGSANT